MSSEPTIAESRKLPEVSTELFILAALIKNLERKSPGLMDEMLETLEDDRLHSEIVRLRGPRSDKRVAEHLEMAVQWTLAARAINAVTPAPPPRPWWDWRK